MLKDFHVFFGQITKLMHIVSSSIFGRGSTHVAYRYGDVAFGPFDRRKWTQSRVSMSSPEQPMQYQHVAHAY